MGNVYSKPIMMKDASLFFPPCFPLPCGHSPIQIAALTTEI